MSYILSANTPPPVLIHLDSGSSSVHQLSSLTTNFTYSLIEPIIVPDHMNILISLHTATIPYSFYNVGNHNNELSVSIDSGGASTLELELGNYSAFGLASVIKDYIEALGVSITTFFMIYSRETLKYKFYFTGSATTITFGDESTCLSLMGVNDGGITITGKVIADASVSDKAVDMNDAIHGLYIRQNLATKGMSDTANGTFTNILARIPITTNAGGIIFFNPADSGHETMVSLPMVQTIGIKLTDDKHRSIDLNGLHFQLSLKISYIHKEFLRQLPNRRPIREKRIKIDEKGRKQKKNKSP
jgi:hypothetical protein